jgi:C1A family cysteine protease
LKSAVKVNPVSICIDASKWSLYKGGVLNNCGTTPNHAVLLVGFDDN